LPQLDVGDLRFEQLRLGSAKLFVERLSYALRGLKPLVRPKLDHSLENGPKAFWNRVGQAQCKVWPEQFGRFPAGGGMEQSRA